MDLSNELSCEARSFSCHHNPPRFFQSEVLRLYFSMLAPWVARSILLPSFSSQFIRTTMWDLLVCLPLPHPVCQLSPGPPRSSSCCLGKSPLHPSCPSLPIWSGWMFFLTPWWSSIWFDFLVVLVFVFKFVVVLLLQNRPRGVWWMIYYDRLDPPCALGVSPQYYVCLVCHQGKTSLNARDWWKGKELFIQKVIQT